MKNKGSLPKNKNLWRVRGNLLRESGELKEEVSELMTMNAAESAVFEWRQLGVKDANYYADDEAVEAFRKSTELGR